MATHLAGMVGIRTEMLGIKSTIIRGIMGLIQGTSGRIMMIMVFISLMVRVIIQICFP